MYHRQKFTVGLCCLLLAGAVSAQNSIVQRDPHAATILNQMIGATGWTHTSLPKDIAAYGTISLDTSTTPQTISFVLKAREGHQFRSEISNGAVVTVVNGEQGIVTKSGIRTQLPVQSALSIFTPSLPFFTVLGELDSPEVSFDYIGQETVDSTLAYRVSIQRNFSLGDPLDGTRTQLSRVVVSVSSVSGLPLKIEYTVLADDNPSASQRVTCHLSDYRKVGSILTPYRLDEFVDNRHIRALDITTIETNVGLSDADFSLN